MTTTGRPRPRLVFSTAPFYRMPLREAFRHVAEAGFGAVEVMVNQDPHTQEPRLLSALAQECGLQVDAIHAPFLLITRRVWGTDPVGKIYRSVHLAEEVGASLVVIHPPYRWQLRYQRWIEEDLADFSTRTGVTVAVENMFPFPFPGQRGIRVHATQGFEDLERFPYLVLDTSHAAVSGLDIRSVFHQYHDRIQHVHLSNNAGKGWDSHLPVYADGVLPVGDFLNDIAANSYRGNVSLELDLRPWMQDPADLQRVLVRNREFCEAYLGATNRAPQRG